MTHKNNKKLSSDFKKYASCTCAGVGGFALGHLGCIITPLAIASGSTLALSASTSLIALGVGLAASAGGVYLWNKLRGHKASKIEKRMVFGSAICGALLSIALHFNRHAQHHNDPNDIKNREIIICRPPPSIQPTP